VTFVDRVVLHATGGDGGGAVKNASDAIVAQEVRFGTLLKGFVAQPGRLDIGVD